MTRRTIARLAGLDRAELAWRSAAGARIASDRARAAIVRPRWNRRELASRLAHAEPGLSADRLDRIRRMLNAGHFVQANRELARHLSSATQRFVIAQSTRHDLVHRIVTAFRAGPREAAARADRVLFGYYDLLGYRGLRFDGSGEFRWNYDPVHDRAAPRRFWSRVPYLDPSCGDHKIIWELNRHQHWLTLGRAFWLTGETKYRERCLTELASWLEGNPPLTGINWASMLELGLRSLSWLWALHFFVDPDADDASPWIVDLLLGLDRQLTHVERNLSFYFSPNTHLLGEALALYVTARALPELAASRRREAIGRHVLVREIERQIAPDGGHREQSTHYHRYALDFYLLALLVARITNDPAAAVFEPAVARLAAAARLLADDRGRLPHIGDDDSGALLRLTGRPPDDVRDCLAAASATVGRPDLRIGPVPEEALWLLGHPAAEPRTGRRGDDSSPFAGIRPAAGGQMRSGALPDTGYYVSRDGDGTHLVIDGGPHGYQNGGHAHADALSLTCTIRGVPLLIDPGTGSYTADLPLRDRLRSTALHNTLTLDDRPQSTPAGPFHWLRAADAQTRRWRTNEAFDYFEGLHDGYRPLVHRRFVLVLHGDLLVVADLADGPGVHTGAVHWHLDPRWNVEVCGRQATLTLSDRARASAAGGCASTAHPGSALRASRREVALFVPEGSIRLCRGDAATGLGWYSPAYGRLEATTTIRLDNGGAAPFWTTSVFDLNRRNPVGCVEWLPVWAEGGTLARGVALRISRAASTDYLLIAEPASGPDPRSTGSPRLAAHGSTWRIAEFETDARMLFCRISDERRVAQIALVDGSLVRSSGRRGVQLVLPRPVTDLHVDLTGEARIAGPSVGARLTVGGRDCAVAPPRLAAPAN